MAATADSREPEQRRRVGRISPRVTAFVAGAFGALSVAFSLMTVLFAYLNNSSLRLFLEYLLTPILVGSVSVVGVLVASRRSDNPLGWIYLIVGFCIGLVGFAWEYAVYALVTNPGSSMPGGPLMSWLGAWAWIPGAVLLLTFALLLFPDGRLPSPRWRPIAWLSAVPLTILVPNAIWLWPHRGRAFVEHPNRFEPGGLLGTLLDLMVPLVLVCGLACVTSLGVRFWRSRGVERLQIKWFVFAAAVSLLFTGIAQFYNTPVTDLLSLLILASMPVAVGMSILRYRLYDIDVIINRTLVYGSLTVVLALVYLGGVTLLQGVLQALTGQESTLAVVASTLAIAALFSPLRRRMQGFVDRRFYRRKYDARKTLDAFSATLKDETDLVTLNNELVSVVRETMLPAHVSLWLRPDNSRKGTEVVGSAR